MVVGFLNWGVHILIFENFVMAQKLPPRIRFGWKLVETELEPGLRFPESLTARRDQGRAGWPRKWAIFREIGILQILAQESISWHPEGLSESQMLTRVRPEDFKWLVEQL